PPATRARPMTIIDAWIQHPTPSFIGDPMFESLRRGMGMTSIPSTIPVEFTLAALDAAKIERALITAWWGPQGPLLGNDEVAALTRAHPQRLFGVGSVDLRRPMAAVAEIRRCVTELASRPIRVLPWLWELPSDDRRYYPI